MEVSTTTWRTRPAFQVTTPGLCFIVMETGAHLASLLHPGAPPSSNPLWQPQWPSGDPATAAALGTWGAGEHAAEAPLLASICGSNLCADRFGPSHAGEPPRPLHGESGVARFAWVRASPTACAFEAHLPLSGLTVQRTFTVEPSAPTTLRIESRLRLGSGAAAPQALEVCEHTTLGNDFLCGARVTASTGPLAYDMPQSGSAQAPPELPAAAALRVPAAGDPPEGSVRTLPVAPAAPGGGLAFWAALNPRLGLRLSCTWRAADLPWLCLWTEHRLRTHAPWQGRERTRGMEISTKPFPEDPPAQRARAFLGLPTGASIAPGEEVVKALELTWEAVPREEA
jgi:hypothetical protein